MRPQSLVPNKSVERCRDGVHHDSKWADGSLTPADYQTNHGTHQRCQDFWSFFLRSEVAAAGFRSSDAAGSCNKDGARAGARADSHHHRFWFGSFWTGKCSGRFWFGSFLTGKWREIFLLDAVVVNFVDGYDRRGLHLQTGYYLDVAGCFAVEYLVHKAERFNVMAAHRGHQSRCREREYE